jgi:hypothetical protein
MNLSSGVFFVIPNCLKVKTLYDFMQKSLSLGANIRKNSDEKDKIPK